MLNPKDRHLQALRAMAWERAKGELRSMLVTFYGKPSQFSELDVRIKEFIEIIEYQGLAE